MPVSLPRPVRVCSVALAAAAVTLAAGCTVGSRQATDTALSAGVQNNACTKERIPVRVSSVPAVLAGTLCVPAGGASDLQVLIPGATYTRSYWMWPGRSYAAAANSAGYATFAMDRPDTGQSSQIHPALVTVTADAQSVHQAISWLQGRFRFTRIVLVGHSLGSIVAVRENGMYPDDAAALVLSGYSTWISPSAMLSAGSATPAQLSGDPALEHRPLGEVTASDSVRAQSFHAAGDSEPSVIAADNASKDTLTVSELAGTFTETDVLGLAARQVTAPVLLALGGKDALYYCGPATPCGSSSRLVSAERPYFPHAPVLDGYVLPRSGHAMNLADNASQWFTAAQTWIVPMPGAARPEQVSARPTGQCRVGPTSRACGRRRRTPSPRVFALPRGHPGATP